MDQLTEEEAILMYKTEFWKTQSHRERAEFQIQQKRLCMPFYIFHQAMEDSLGRIVSTLEFGLSTQQLKDELFNGSAPLSFELVLERFKEKFVNPDGTLKPMFSIIHALGDTAIGEELTKA